MYGPDYGAIFGRIVMFGFVGIFIFAIIASMLPVDQGCFAFVAALALTIWIDHMLNNARTSIPLDSSTTPATRQVRTGRKYGKGYPANWGEISQQVKKRDGYKCRNCGGTKNLHAHHIVPRVKGGTHELTNLATICRKCHKKIHPHMN
jgi:hypothetical protein